MALLDRFKKKPKTVEPRSQLTSIKKTSKGKKEAVKKIGIKDKTRLAQIYSILREPHIAEKATDLAEPREGASKYVFKVALKANKIEIKKAVEDLYGIRVVNVRVVRIPAKRRRLGRSEGWKGGQKRGYKKAYIKLHKGDKIEIMPR